MTNGTDGQFRETTENNVVEAFEQILEVMPDDRATLEALHDACLSQGQTQKALKYLLRLADLVQIDGEPEVLTNVLIKLHHLGNTHPEALEKAIAIETQRGESRIYESVTSKETRSAHARIDIGHEISLAWMLAENGKISEEEYTQITNDMTELSGHNKDVPVSVLHAIHDRKLPQEEDILAYLSDKGQSPIIKLSSFDVQPDVFNILPVEFMTRRGALTFDRIGDELMVAILNPFDESTKNEVREIAKADCHFFLVGASEYDRTLTKMKIALQKAQKQ